MIILLGYAMVFLRREITATSSFLWVSSSYIRFPHPVRVERNIEEEEERRRIYLSSFTKNNRPK